MKKIKVLARHKWVHGATITESEDTTKDGEIAWRRFTATIRGWRGWKIYEGFCREGIGEEVRRCVEEIKTKIDAGEETVFHHKGYFLK
jgi:hypothetical protein